MTPSTQTVEYQLFLPFLSAAMTFSVFVCLVVMGHGSYVTRLVEMSSEMKILPVLPRKTAG